MDWKYVDSPGYLGGKRDAKMAEWDETYGVGNWRLIWLVNNVEIDLMGACALYEDAYFYFLLNHPRVLEQLITEASNVYDDEVSNVHSGFDYSIQETKRTHLQDIAIRRVLIRMGLWFKGKHLIRIRQELGDHPLSLTLSPGIVPFHRPKWILAPVPEGKWYENKSVENFYQQNRILQRKYPKPL